MMVQSILVGFCAWRLASLLVDEDGPWEVFERFRRLMGVPAIGPVVGFFPLLLTCFYCTSIWTAVFAWAFWEFVSPWPVALMAAATVALIVERARYTGAGSHG